MAVVVVDADLKVYRVDCDQTTKEPTESPTFDADTEAVAVGPVREVLDVFYREVQVRAKSETVYPA
jgi:hypothetical protein